MGILRSLMIRFGLADLSAERNPISVFLLDDDSRRHRWFKKRFINDEIDIAETVEEAKKILAENSYDAIFLDHDLLPHHYESDDHDDYARTGYAVVEWLNENKDFQRAATIIVHTRNSNAGERMIKTLKEGGRNAEYVPFTLLDIKIKNYWQR